MPGLTWEAVGVILAAVVAWSGMLLGIIKWLLGQYAEGIKKNFEELGRTLKGHSEEMHRLDKEILKLRGDLARDYFSRDDHIRYETVINAKVDALATKIENLILRSTRAERKS